MPAFPADLADTLARRQRELSAGAAAERNAAALAEGARAVVTGQQPGLLGGPLLVLHKAAGAIAEAARRSTPSRPVIPVFWVASDDHDWDEVNQATVMDESDHPRSLSLPMRRDGRSICDVAVDETTSAALLASLSSALEGAARRDEAVAVARAPTAPCDLGTWFASIVARLLGDSGLVFVEPRVLSPFAGETYASLVRHADAIGAAVRDAGHRGIGPRGEVTAGPLDRPRAQAPLFLRDGPHGVRRRVAFHGDRVLLRGQPTDLDGAALEALVRAQPELASADVVGRVLLQDALLPVDAYVAGPTEATYLAQIEPAHAILGIAAPAIVARPSAAWAELEQVDAIRAAGIDPSAVVASGLFAAGTLPFEVNDTVRRGAFRALEALRPRNKPQERVLSPLSIVARHGVDALRAGLRRVAESAGPAIVTLP